MQRDPLPGGRVPCISPSEGTRFRQSHQTHPEHPKNSRNQLRNGLIVIASAYDSTEGSSRDSGSSI